MRKFGSTLAFAGAGLLLGSPVVFGGVTAVSVDEYTAGDFTNFSSEVGYTNTSAALGTLQGDTGFGALTPFNPAFSKNQIIAVGEGGQLTLHLGQPLTTAGGPNLGVFSNNGIQDASGNGSGKAGAPAVTFNDPDHPEAIVSVSQNGLSFVTLNNGNPILFANPGNYYLDQTIVDYSEPLGAVVADQFKPFTGTLSSFDGETFAQIKTTLNGSAGGTWLDLSGTGLTTVSDVRFTVPANAGYSFVVDSVSAVPEPVLGLPLLACSLFMRRNRKR